MAIKLDLRNPTIVIAGAWNQAILNEAAWIAENVLELAPGQELQIRQIVMGDQFATQKLIHLYEDFGLCCLNSRLEIFEKHTEDIDKVYSVLIKISEKLPYTPIGAVGVNFRILIEENIEGILSQFETKETFDAVGRIVGQSRSDTILLEPKDTLVPDQKIETNLNIVRNSDFSSVTIDINYHQLIQKTGDLGEWLKGRPVEHWRKHANTLLKECYGIDELAEQSF